MSFIDSIDDHIKSMQQIIADKQSSLTEYIHDCNCDFCDRQGEPLDDEDEAIAEGIQEAIKENKKTLELLKKHKADYAAESKTKK